MFWETSFVRILISCIPPTYAFDADIPDYILPRFVIINKFYTVHDERDFLFDNIVQRKKLRHLEQSVCDDRTFVEFCADKTIITAFVQTNLYPFIHCMWINNW